MKSNVKQDLNFLEYPMWSTSKSKIIEKNIYSFRNGEYEYTCMDGPPKSFDIKLLNFILMCSQKNDFSNEIEFRMYNALQVMNITPNGSRYDRIKKSLSIWKNIVVTFQHFYDNKKYFFAQFNIINDYSICRKTNIINLEIGKRWINQIKKSKFFKNLDMKIYMSIKKPFTLRLFEILEKHLAFRDNFTISIEKLSQKIWTDEELKKYKRRLFPSDIITKIKKSIKEINIHISNTNVHNYIIELVATGRGMLSNIKFSKHTIPQEKYEETENLNQGSKDMHPEIAKWLRKKHVSESKVQHIVSKCKNVEHSFHYIKENFDERKHKPGWIVSAFQNNFFGNFPPYKEYKKAEDNGFDFDDWVKV